jgi:hypothetical protein
MHEKRGPPPDAAQQELAFTDRSITVFNAAIDCAGGKRTNASTDDLDFFFSERMSPLPNQYSVLIVHTALLSWFWIVGATQSCELNEMRALIGIAAPVAIARAGSRGGGHDCGANIGVGLHGCAYKVDLLDRQFTRARADEHSVI